MYQNTGGKLPASALDALHNLVGETLAHQINRYREGGDLEGEPIPPQLIGQAIKFLKDNGIEAIPTASNGLGHLTDSLPFVDEA